jgi:hypothetical protein
VGCGGRRSTALELRCVSKKLFFWDAGMTYNSHTPCLCAYFRSRTRSPPSHLSAFDTTSQPCTGNLDRTRRARSRSTGNHPRPADSSQAAGASPSLRYLVDDRLSHLALPLPFHIVIIPQRLYILLLPLPLTAPFHPLHEPLNLPSLFQRFFDINRHKPQPIPRPHLPHPPPLPAGATRGDSKYSPANASLPVRSGTSVQKNLDVAITRYCDNRHVAIKN